MPTIVTDTVLTEVEHILASGVGVLDFSVADESEYYTWWGTEDADWSVTDVERIENVEEDRLMIYPTGDYFTCEILAEADEENPGPVHCYCE